MNSEDAGAAAALLAISAAGVRRTGRREVRPTFWFWSILSFRQRRVTGKTCGTLQSSGVA